LCNPQGRADSGCSHKWDSQCTLQSPAMQWSRPKLMMQAVYCYIFGKQAKAKKSQHFRQAQTAQVVCLLGTQASERPSLQARFRKKNLRQQTRP